MYKLHCFAQSGNAYKVALLLQALRQPWTPIHLPFADFTGGKVRSDDWRQDVNAMGEVPVLEVDGKSMTQSAAIMLWLANKHGAYGGKSDDARQEVMRWLERLKALPGWKPPYDMMPGERLAPRW